MFGKKKKLDTAAEGICPLLAEPCIKARCHFWVHIRGKNPQTGADMDFPDCSIRWLPVLMLENTKAGVELGAAVESARNEAAKSAEKSDQLMIAAATGQLAPAPRQDAKLVNPQMDLLN